MMVLRHWTGTVGAAAVILTVFNLSCGKQAPGEQKGPAVPSPKESEDVAPPEQGHTGQKEAPLPSPKELLVVDLGGGVTMEFVLIHPGSFMMGSEKGNYDEKPVHKVTISKPFYLGKCEVTQEQWQALMSANPAKFKGPKYPVEEVSWEDCQAFLQKLSEKVAGGGFRLPTEAEWEYACRAGSTTDFCYGDDQAGLSEYAWYHNNSKDTTHPVGQKKANSWGLFDMHGNVWEWCADRIGAYAPDALTDPKGPGTGDLRVLRGGSWRHLAQSCRSAVRNRYKPDDQSNTNLGLRTARTVE